VSRGIWDWREVLLFDFKAGLSGLLDGIEIAQVDELTVDLDSSPPLAILLVPTDSFDSTGVILEHTLIDDLFALRSLAQITSAVIDPVAIDVVYRERILCGEKELMEI